MRELAEESPEERAAPQTDREHTPEEHHRVDARASLPRPVHVLEGDPERELVERKRRGTAIEDRREFRQGVVRARGSLCRVELDEPEIAGAEESGDAEDEVVEMAATHGEVAERPDPVADRVGDHSG